MAERTVPMECAACGNRWDVGPKPDGTMPVGARCPRDRGGCGKVRKVPRGAARAALAPASPLADLARRLRELAAT